MKYLSDYMNDKQSALFSKYGVFFAFSKEQFLAARKEGVKYVDVGAGMIVPKEHVKVVHDSLEQIYQDGIKQDIEENGKEAIIKRELGNYECYYTGDISDAVEALEDYGISREQITSVFQGKALVQKEEITEELVWVRESKAKPKPAKQQAKKNEALKEVVEKSTDDKFSKLIENGQVKDFQHTRTGEMLRVLVIAEDLGKDGFIEFNKHMIKSGIGYYSRPAGGWILKDKNVA